MEFQAKNYTNPDGMYCKKDEDEDEEYDEDNIIDMMFPNGREEWDNE